MEQKVIIPSSDADERGVNLHQYAAVILKRKWLLVVITVLAAISAAIYSFSQTPLYQARTSLLIDRATYTFVPDVLTQGQQWQSKDTFFNTEFKILKSKVMSIRVAKRLGLRPSDLVPIDKKQEQSNKDRPPLTEEQINRVAAYLLGFVKIESIRDTNLCEVVVASPDPKLSMMLANAWAEEYVDYSLASEYENTQKAQEVLDEQIKSVRQGIAEKEKMLHEFSLQRQIVKLDKERSMSSQGLEDLSTAITEASQQRISKEVIYNDLRTQTPSSTAAVINSASVVQLKAEYSKMELQYAEKTKTYKLDYPEMIRMRSQLEVLKQKIDKEMKEVFVQTVAAARAVYLGALNEEKALKNQLGTARMQAIGQQDKESSYDSLVQEIEQKKSLLTALLQKRNEAGVSEPVMEKKATTIRIVDRAELPASIYSPKIIPMVLLSMLVGLGVSIGLAVLLEFLDRSLKNSEDVERFAHLPTLGIIPLHFREQGNGTRESSMPLVRRDGTDNHQTDLLVLYSTDSVASEAIRTVRTSLLLSFPERAPHSILITSSKPGEGKTFVACNLALSLAQLNKKVLLIDADLRNPRLHRVWGFKNETGLSRLLTSNAAIEDIVKASPVPGLSILTSGPKTPRPAELLASSRCQLLMQSFRESYDHVILDSPPILPVADSMILAGACDCVVMVIRGGNTARDVVQMAVQQLAKTEAVVAGAILNGIDLTDPYYYYSYYSSYKSYYGGGNQLPPPDRQGSGQAVG